jgi:hypothetical protein
LHTGSKEEKTMALGVSTATAFLNHLFNATNTTAPTAIYLSLHTADPGTTGANECADGTYARVNVTSSFSTAASAACTNDVAIEYAALTTGATITHYGLWSAVSAGTFLHGGDVNPDKAVGAGEIARFAIGELDITG